MIPRSTIGVYLIRNTITDTVYVGSSVKSIHERWLRHIKALRENRHDNQRLQRAWNKYGEATFEFVVCEEVPSADVRAREQYWIDWFLNRDPDKCYNLSRLATGGGPHEWTPEMRARLSAGQMGRTVSETTREKLRQKFKGRPLSKEHCAKLSEAHKGYKPTPEAVEKRSAAQRGIPKSRIVYEGLISPDGQEYRNILNLKKFALEHDIDYGHLNKVARGIEFSCQGWRRIGTASRAYHFIAPDGTEYRNIQSLEAFCREHGLGHDCMRLVHIGKQPRHRGWRKA